MNIKFIYFSENVKKSLNHSTGESVGKLDVLRQPFPDAFQKVQVNWALIIAAQVPVTAAFMLNKVNFVNPECYGSPDDSIDYPRCYVRRLKQN